ncbi:hypothetical protein NDU88_002709 [Pleurodeles waltl]|uniref:Uncharacterized protein n=1 Tax=Pleurodeles waltl TaxID=8319 RepID=A0AAV7QAN8_PLEWA|nr:hypothetical protein NDU88_002709 [Pleurodeles waltl]
MVSVRREVALRGAAQTLTPLESADMRPPGWASEATSGQGMSPPERCSSWALNCQDIYGGRGEAARPGGREGAEGMRLPLGHRLGHAPVDPQSFYWAGTGLLRVWGFFHLKG